MSQLFTAATPVAGLRAVHLDLKGLPPTPERLISLLNVFAAARYNAVLVEWEDVFPWTVDDRFRSETAYTPEQVDRFHSAARKLGIQIIPLVQCLGHMETPLRLEQHRALREIPDFSDVINPLAPGARELVERMIDDVIARTPGLRYFHIGGDEAWTFGSNPDTRAFIAAHGKGALYLRHVEPILDKLLARGIRPILWHDMMIEWDQPSLQRLAAKADLCVWGYGGHPDTTPHHFNTRYIERFAAAGIRMWGGTAYKGADGPSADLPDLANRQANAQAWADVAARFHFDGLIATAWSRYSTDRVQCEPIDAALDSLVNVGVILHDGRPPVGGIDACVAALESLGERERFERCKVPLQAMAKARREGAWAAVELREQIVTSTLDTRRRGSPLLPKSLHRLRESLAAAQSAGQQIRVAFAGLIDSLWIDRYLAERIEPLRQQLEDFESRLRRVYPESLAVADRLAAPPRAL